MKTVLTRFFYAFLALAGALPSCGQDKNGGTLILHSEPAPLEITFQFGVSVDSCVPALVQRADSAKAQRFDVSETGGNARIFVDSVCTVEAGPSQPLLFAPGEKRKELYVLGKSETSSPDLLNLSDGKLSAMAAFNVSKKRDRPTDPGCIGPGC